MRPGLVADLVQLLPAGHDRAVPLPEVASQLGVTVRVLQGLVVEAIEDGFLIGSRCTETPGLFRILNLDDLEIGTRHIRNRAISSLRRCRALERAARERFATYEVGRLFDLEQVG